MIGRMASPTSERAIVFCVGAVNFVNMLDFVIVMPLGPDYATALGIPLSRLGYVGAAYTAAASIAGLAGAFFLDRFDRKKALAVAMAGLVLGTLSCALARGLGTLVLARVLAGAFGGPATSLAFSIIADVVPPERRGRAMGAVMGGFSVASIVGVPAGLELARFGGWKLPFIAVAIVGAIVAAYAYAVLPSMVGHLAQARGRRLGRDFLELARVEVGLSLLMTSLLMAGTFAMIPNIASYLIYNLGYPRSRLGFLYFLGGAISFATMRGVGRLVDRFGSARVGTAGMLFIATVTYLGFARTPSVLPVMGIFILFMCGVTSGNVTYSTLTTKVPRPPERARFSSMQSAVQHAACAIGAFASAQILTELSDHTLVGLEIVAYASIALVVGVVPLLWIVERRVVPRP